MKINSKKTALALAISAVLILSACNDNSLGGTWGGGPMSSVGFTLTAMDGYINNAVVCVDINENSRCEINEIVLGIDGNPIQTDKNGKIDAKIPPSTNDLIKDHTLIVATLRSFEPDSDDFSEDMDLPGQSMNPVILRAPAGSKIVSPITDLIVGKMNVGGQTRAGTMSKEEAQKAVLDSLYEIDPDRLLTEGMLYEDYIEDKLSPDANRILLAQKSHKLAQILTESKANARSDLYFDKFSDEVVVIAVQAVVGMSTENLIDLGYKPYVAVGKGGVGELVVNKKIKFNLNVMTKFATLLDEQKGLYGEVGAWLEQTIKLNKLVNDDDKDHRKGIEALVTDRDDGEHNKSHEIFVLNKKKLAENNLDVVFKRDPSTGNVSKDSLVISRVDEKVAIAGGKYSILISTNDLNAAGKPIKITDENNKEHDVLTTSVTQLIFTVTNDNDVPVINKLTHKTIAEEIAGWPLRAGEEVSGYSVDITGLFSDSDGSDLFEYGAKNVPTGMTVTFSGSQLTLKGTPEISVLLPLTISAKDEGKLVTFTSFDLAIRAEEGSFEN